MVDTSKHRIRQPKWLRLALLCGTLTWVHVQTVVVGAFQGRLIISFLVFSFHKLVQFVYRINSAVLIKF